MPYYKANFWAPSLSQTLWETRPRSGEPWSWSPHQDIQLNQEVCHLGIGVDCNEPLFLINNIIIYIEGKVIISRPLLIAVEQQ